MKSREFEPYESEWQFVVRDHKHSYNVPENYRYIDRKGNGKQIKELDRIVPLKTVFAKGKDYRRAKKRAEKYGEVISGHKVDSQYRRLEMTEHLRVNDKPIKVDITLDDFIVGRDLQIEEADNKNISIGNK